jgi:hypothetical protein
MGFDFVGLIEEAPLDWSEFANRFCTGVLGRTPQLPSCGNRVTTMTISIASVTRLMVHTYLFYLSLPFCIYTDHFDYIFSNRLDQCEGSLASIPRSCKTKRLRMKEHCLPATLEVTGSNPGPGKINLIETNTNGIPDSKKVHLSMRKRGRLS